MAKVKLLHWNILFSEKSENIVDLVVGCNPDIFCCQEINEQPRGAGRPNLVEQLSAIFPFHYFQPADLIGSGGEELKLGNAIFSKFPLSNSRKVDIYDQPNPTSKNKTENRIYVEATADVNGQPLVVGTTHMSFGPQFGDTADRLEQAANLMEVIKNQTTRYVITGDFNSRPDTKIVRQIEKYLVSAGPPHDQPTFTTIPFSYLGFDVTGLDWRVDYIFTSRDIKVASSEIISTKFSDHLPILAELEL